MINNNGASSSSKKLIIAFVGMPGAGKSEAVSYLQKKGIPFVRFGEITDEGVKQLGLPLTPDNEQNFREKLRQKNGMAAYAILAKPKIEELLKQNRVVAIDGLYSWEEYVYLTQFFPELTLIHVYAEPKLRYNRLAHRKIRPVSFDHSRKRDIMELEKLNKGGPIAIADFLIENNNDDISKLYEKIDQLLNQLGSQNDRH